ncbi:MAG: cytidylate kinase-like family protein [Lachnospiraceae bacterium]|nr:cytidylate kinase-like family protein [Lachnospiraceae bacterium]MDE7415174.1 cytidylate kinase-like family protein [Lachnospiraceae bacterium]
MEKQLIISVGREYGSGGHEIAERLSKHYGIQLFDHNLLDEIAAEKHLDMRNLRGLDEKHRSRLASRTVRGYSSSPEENLYLLQFDYLKNKASSGESFVVVGRCSETILKECDSMISIFVLGDMDKKIERIMRLYQLSKDQAVWKIREKDMKRKRYHNDHCDGKWGDSRNYDLCINSSKLGIDGTVALLTEYIDKRHIQQ